jgi:phosphohistidine swiveling domain-containing protein
MSVQVGFAPGTPEFPIEWLDGADPEIGWERDDMHTPFALAPLAADYIRVLCSGFASGYEYSGIPAEIRCRIWNGYVYFGRWSALTDDETAPLREVAVRRRQDHEKLVAAYWRDEAVPELEALYDWIDRLEVEDMTAAELAEAWDPAWDRVARAWWIHFYTIIGPYQVLDDLADFLEASVKEVTISEAFAMVQGAIDDLQDVDRGIERLTELAAAAPRLATRLKVAPPPTMDELATVEGGQFMSQLREFLSVHGHLGQGFDDLSLASWAEEPSLLLGEIAKRLRDPRPPSDERRASVSAEGAALERRISELLADRPEERKRFEELVKLAREISPLTEGHNYWIDRKAQARLRVFVMRVGRRLVDAGVINEPADILYLERAEVPPLLRVPADRRSLVAERKTEHARQRTLTAPQNVGKAPGEPAGVDRFDGVRIEPTDRGTMRGTGASAGIARGPARIVLGPADFDRVQQGDIIVAPSSNPSWVPLFTIAAGLVTNTGGVLCHAAVVAREFRLPAVVGVPGATSSITDGQELEIDGLQGTIRLL